MYGIPTYRYIILYYTHYTVGAVIVSHPGQPRIDLVTLHAYLEQHLHRSKWPQIIVYMNALPKNAAGKILRIKLAERFKLKNVNEEVY